MILKKRKIVCDVEDKIGFVLEERLSFGFSLSQDCHPVEKRDLMNGNSVPSQLLLKCRTF